MDIRLLRPVGMIAALITSPLLVAGCAKERRRPASPADLASTSQAVPQASSAKATALPPVATTQHFLPLGVLHVARGHHSATTLANGDVLLTGGIAQPQTPTAALERIDARSGQIELLGATLITARYEHQACLLADGRVWISGGRDRWQGAPLPTTEIYDPRTRSVTTGPDLQLARAGHLALSFQDGGRELVLVAGGLATAAGALTSTAAAEVFDPQSLSTRTLPYALLQDRYRARATRLPSGEILVQGGWRIGVAGASAGTADLEIFAGLSQGFRAGPLLVQPRADNALLLLSSGDIVITGGRDSQGLPLSDAEILAPQAAVALRGAQTAARGRYEHELVELPSAQVLVIGGRDAAGQPLAETERFDPAGGGFQSDAALLVGRTGHQALRMGVTLIVCGGFDAAQQPIDLVEFYGPGAMAALPPAQAMPQAPAQPASPSAPAPTVIVTTPPSPSAPAPPPVPTPLPAPVATTPTTAVSTALSVDLDPLPTPMVAGVPITAHWTVQAGGPVTTRLEIGIAPGQPQVASADQQGAPGGFSETLTPPPGVSTIYVRAAVEHNGQVAHSQEQKLAIQAAASPPSASTTPPPAAQPTPTTTPTPIVTSSPSAAAPAAQATYSIQVHKFPGIVDGGQKIRIEWRLPGAQRVLENYIRWGVDPAQLDQETPHLAQGRYHDEFRAPGEGTVYFQIVAQANGQALTSPLQQISVRKSDIRIRLHAKPDQARAGARVKVEWDVLGVRQYKLTGLVWGTDPAQLAALVASGPKNIKDLIVSKLPLLGPKHESAAFDAPAEGQTIYFRIAAEADGQVIVTATEQIPVGPAVAFELTRFPKAIQEGDDLRIEWRVHGKARLTDHRVVFGTLATALDTGVHAQGGYHAVFTAPRGQDLFFRVEAQADGKPIQTAIERIDLSPRQVTIELGKFPQNVANGEKVRVEWKVRGARRITRQVLHYGDYRYRLDQQAPVRGGYHAEFRAPDTRQLFFRVETEADGYVVQSPVTPIDKRPVQIQITQKPAPVRAGEALTVQWRILDAGQWKTAGVRFGTTAGQLDQYAPAQGRGGLLGLFQGDLRAKLATPRDAERIHYQIEAEADGQIISSAVESVDLFPAFAIEVKKLGQVQSERDLQVEWLVHHAEGLKLNRIYYGTDPQQLADYADAGGRGGFLGLFQGNHKARFKAPRANVGDTFYFQIEVQDGKGLTLRSPIWQATYLR